MNDYKLIQFPEVQTFMSFSWFDEECCLANSDNFIEMYGSSCYFVPTHRIEEYLEKLHGEMDSF